MTGFTVLLVLVVAAAVLLRWRRPAWYWMTFGVTFAAVRVAFRYASVMDACGLTVPPSRWRLTLARMTNRPAPESRAPRILRLRRRRPANTRRGAATAGSLRQRRPAPGRPLTRS